MKKYTRALAVAGTLLLAGFGGSLGAVAQRGHLVHVALAGTAAGGLLRAGHIR